jgi:hypothetical protein
VFPKQVFPIRVFPSAVFSRLNGATPTGHPTSQFNGRGFGKVAFNGSLQPAPINGRGFDKIAFTGAFTSPQVAVASTTPNTLYFNSRPFSSVAFNSSLGPVTYVTQSIRQAVAAWLRTLTGLTQLVGTRIYWSDPSQIAKYPCIAVKVNTRDYGYNLSGHDGTSLATVQITALALTESSAISVIEIVRNNFQGFRGLQSGVPILWCYLGDEADGTTEPPDGSDQWIYQAAVEYRIKHRVPMPTSVTQTNV